MRTEHWQARFALFQRELINAPRNAIVFLGDSITEEFAVASMFPDVTVLNRGISGDHIDGVMERLDNSALKLQPSKLFLLIGINDIGERRSTRYITTAYAELLTVLQQKLPQSTTLFVQSILPVGGILAQERLDQIYEINHFLADYCRKHSIKYIDLFRFFHDGDGILKAAYSPDDLHLNEDGYLVWAQVIKEYIDI